ncbi:MAG TPA: hypothetical protein VLD61_09360, partial [Methylomirabilota bacterium]|nr:hypothetical protein [Methylomirabilota bacterium]
MLHRTVGSAPLLARFLEALLFLRAYPDDPDVMALAERALVRFAERLRPRPRGRPSAPTSLDERGIAGTALFLPLSLRAARWLASRGAGQARLDRDATPGDLDPILPHVVPPSREEALVDIGVPFWRWLDAALPRNPRSDLGWVTDRVADAGAAAIAVYDLVQPRIRWDLGTGPMSRTRLRTPSGPPFYHTEPLRRGRGTVGGFLRTPVPARAPVGGEALAFLDAAQAAVLTRYREVHAFNWADPRDVTLADLGRGVRLAWFGIRPSRRLPLRAHYGYLLAKNGVPVGYGDASLLFEWVNLAYNVFETYRGGEAAVMLVRLLAFLHQHFGTRVFHLDRYQIGYANEEALASGAYWFYDRLGFRSRQLALRRLAAAERRRLAADPGYRSPRETLARLAEDGVVLSLGRSQDHRARTFDIGRLGRRALALTHAGGDGEAALTRRAAARLGVRGLTRWRAGERAALAGWAPVLLALRGLDRWPSRERGALRGTIRAKAGPREA